MRHGLLFAPALLLTLPAAAQNLVPNPGFELYVPDSVNNNYGNGTITKAQDWLDASWCTADYYHSDYNYVWPGRVPHNNLGTQVPHGGNAYAGIYAFEVTSIPEIRDYIRAQLLAPLQAGEAYTVSLYASLADSSTFAASFGVNFSGNALLSYSNCRMLVPEHVHAYTNTDKQNWTHVTGTYVAAGGEQFITIGGFNDDQNSDTVTVGGAYPNAYYYIDDVSVTPAHPDGMEETGAAAFALYPNPAEDALYIESYSDAPVKNIRVTDITGRVVGVAWAQNGRRLRLDVAQLASGVYVVQAGDACRRFIKQ